MSESTITSDILRELRQNHDVFAVKIVGGPYQMSGLPDVLLLKDGRYIWIEFKVEDKVVRPAQAAMHKQLKKHGARWHVVRFMESKYWVIDDFYNLRFKLFKQGVKALLELLLALEEGGTTIATTSDSTPT